MGGASYRFYRKEKLAVSAQGLGGVGWGIFSGGAKGIGTDLGLWPDGLNPAFSVGVNADYNFYPNLAFRVTPTYVGTTFGGHRQHRAEQPRLQRRHRLPLRPPVGLAPKSGRSRSPEA